MSNFDEYRKKMLEKYGNDSSQKISSSNSKYEPNNQNSQPMSSFNKYREKLLNKYSGTSRQDDENEWQRYLKTIDLSKREAISEIESVRVLEDFEQYSHMGASIENPSFEDARIDKYNLWERLFKDEINNPVTFGRENVESLTKRVGGANNSSDVATVENYYRYKNMTEDQVKIYNYYLGKGDKEKAEEYLEYINDFLNQERGKEVAKNVEDSGKATEVLFSTAAGLDSFVSGAGNIDNYLKGTEADPTTVTQYAYDTTSSNNGGVFKAVNDVGYTVGNMLPSILVSSVTGVGGLGLAAMGTSATGNAYAEMRNLGYEDWQSAGYATLVGASEVALQSVLGGISKLGGKYSLSAGTTKLISGLDHALARIAVKLPLNMASEGLEEALQTVLEPAFKAMVTGEEYEAAEWSDIMYSALLGALSAGVMEGLPTIGGEAYRSHKAKKTFGSSNAQTDLVNQGLEFAEGTEARGFAEKYNAKLNAGNSLNGTQLANLYEASESQYVTDDTAKLKKSILQKLGEYGETTDVTPVAEVLVKYAKGEKLSSKDINILNNSKAGHIVLAEMNEVNIKSGGLNNKWAETIGTRRVNPELYNKPLYDLAKSVSGVREAFEKGSVAKTLAKSETAKGTKFDISESGKTIYKKADGSTEDVTVKRVASTKGGLKVELDNGNVVSASDLSFSTKEEGLIYEMIARMEVTPETANELIATFKPKNIQQASMYFTAVPLTYRYGQMNYEAGLKNIGLSEAQKRIAFNRGRADAIQSDKANTKSATKKGAASSEPKSGIIFEDGFVYDEETANELQKASMAGIEVIDKMSNLEVHVFKSKVVNGKRVAYVKGKLVKAPNGYFTDGNKIYIDFEAGNGGEGAMLYTMSHEVTHYIRKWNAKGFRELGDFLIAEYGKQGVPVNALLEAQKEKIKKRYKEEKKTLPSEAKLEDMAYEELVADAMSDMFADPKAYEKLAKLKQKNRTLWEKLGEAIKALLDKLKTALGIYKTKNVAVTQEAMFVRGFSAEAYNKLQDLYLKAFVEADANYEATIGSRNLNDYTEAQNENGEPLFQYRAMEADEDTYRDMLHKWGKMTDVQIDNLFATIDTAMELIKDNLEILDYAWDADIDDRAFSPVKPNSDKLYQVSLDFSTLCRKRILQQTVQAQLQEALNKPLTKEEGIAIRDALIALQEEGRQIEVACALCYVESARMKSPEQIKRFVENREKVIKDFFAGKSGGSMKERIAKAEADARKKLGVGNASLKTLPGKVANEIRDAKKAAKASYTPTAEEQKLIEAAKEMTVSDFTSPEGLENLAKNYPLLFDAYTSYVRNATKSKGIENDTWWRAGDSMKIGDVLIANMNKENGLRSQSWSDFQVIHILDYIGATIELATRNAKEQAYSKVPDYVELMGNTGVMINMSLIPTATFNGTLDYDSVEGIDYKRALELRDKYHKTAGTICIGVDDVQIKLLLADTTIDYVIPFHRSGMSAHIRKAMHIPTWSEYQDYQGESKLSREKALERAKKYGVQLLDASDPNYQKGTSFSEWFDIKEAQQITKMENANPSDKAKQKKYGVMYGGYMAMQNAANNYLKLCAERGLAPKFSHEKADFTAEDNYWKLLIDRKMVDNVTGEVIEQQAIKPIFNQGEVMRILNDEVARYPKVKADQDYAIRTVTEKMLSGEIKGGMSAEAIAKVMKKPVDNVTNVNILASSEDMMHSDRDSSYEDYSKPITIHDVEVLRSIARKSINKFTSEDIKKAQKWAYKYNKDLGVKSPFFRAWFGEWRAHDQSKITVVKIPNVAAESQRSKDGIINKDTAIDGHAWKIRLSGHGERNTRAHAGIEKKSVAGLTNIKELVENAILLDTEVHEHHDNNAVNDYIAFDHKFYALGENESGNVSLYRITVEELFQSKTDTNDLRFHNLKYISQIEKVADDVSGSSNSNKNQPYTARDSSTTEYIVADLYKFVKRFDKEFTPAPEVSKLMLDESGRPKVFYHGTNSEFSVFDFERAGQNWNGDSRLGKGFYFANTENEALQWTEGTNVIKAYLNLKNPLNVDAPTPKNIAKEIDKHIDNKIASFDESSSFISKEQYIKNLQRIKDMYMNDVSMFIDNFKYDDNGKMTDGIREFLSSLKYDGIISKDEVVAFYPEQIKSATDNIGTFNEAEEDIYYSDRDSTYLDAVNRGDMETAQRMVDEAAKESGAMVLNSGTIKHYYHGTDATFTSFDAEKARDGTYGFGFYFSPMKSKASEYGDLKDVYLMTDRIATRLSHNITAKQVNAFLERYNIDLKDSILKYADSIEDWVGYKDDMSIMLDLQRFVVRSMEFDTKKLLNDFIEVFGYDGIRQTNETVLWDNRLIKSADSVTYDDNGKVIPLSERFNTDNSDIRYSDREKTSYAPTFYSHMGKVIDGIRLDKMGANGVVSYLKGRGVKDEEIKWSGIETFLEGKKSVTKAELQEFVAGSQLQIVEQMSDNEEYTRWSDYKLEGGSNYRELVFQMPNSWYSNNAMRAHWGQDAEGVLAHARIQDFEVDGKRMLFIEEIQSDWHNEGKEKGYTTKEYEDATESRDKLYNEYKKLDLAFHKYVRSNEFMTDPEDVRKKKHDWLRNKVEAADKKLREAEKVVGSLKEKGAGDTPDAPFKDTYHEYVLKRLLRMAAEEGYDSIGWTTADIQSDRWSSVYAEGYRIEYDQDIPKFLRKYGKKWGATVGKTALPSLEPSATYYDVNRQEEYNSFLEWQDTVEHELKAQGAPMRNLMYESDDKYWFAFDKVSGVEYDRAEIRKTSGLVWSMDITDSMTDSVLYEGQVMYSERVTDKSVLDFLENQEHITTYKSFVEIDGKLYSPMAAKVKGDDGKYHLTNPSEIGVWQQAVEDPKNIARFNKNGVGYYVLKKDNGKGVTAAYNPYEHSSNLVLNDQFEEAYQRPNLVTVECIIPKSEMTSGYKAKHAKDSTGYLDWKSGTVAGKLKGNKRKVYLSRWLKPVRILSDAEVATMYKDILASKISVPFNVVTPQLRAELEKVGVKIDYEGSPGYQYRQSKKAIDDGTKLSDRDPNAVSNRTLLANALDSIAQNDIEKNKLTQYKKKIALIESEQKKLDEIRAKANELRFTKGRTPSETKQMRDLDFEANQTANRINTYDKQLLNLESTAALKKVLEREKTLLRKRLEQKSKEALKKQKEKDAATVRELMTRHQESRKNAIESRNKTAMRHKIKDIVSNLNKLLLNPTKDQHVPIGLQKVVAEALDAINMDTMNAEERVAYYNDLISKSTDPNEIEMLTKKRDFFEYRDANFKDRITALKNAYAEFKESDDPLIRNAHNEAIENLIKNTADEIGNKSLKDMSLAQLEAVYDMYKAILATVRNSNKMFKEGRQTTVTENSEAVKTEVKEVGGHHDRIRKATKGIKSFTWNLLKPIYALQRIGSKTLTSLFNNVRAGEETYATDIYEAREFFQDKSKTYNYDSWDFKKRYSFKDSAGNDFDLSLDQILSLYAYSKREQADKHLEFGGFVFDDVIEVTEKNKLGIPIKYEVNDATPYRLRVEDLATVISSLTTEQKAFVDEMQTYLSEVMGEKGNEISLAMYDIKMFKEKHYFPLKTSRYFREYNPEQTGNPMLRNSGFTKKTVPKAGNPIVLSNFMDVWTSHVNDMSMYHSFVLPLEDFMRVYNYSSTAGGYDSVQQYIKNAYGAEANQYIEKLMQDINGGVISGNIQNGWLKMFGKFKKAAVSASVSTIVQQPTAVIRAMAIINPKYFVGVPFKGGHKKIWNEIKKYAPVAIIKEMGGFDVGSGRQAKDFITSQSYKGFGKVKGFFTDSSYRDSVFMWGATKADELGWNSIWKAVKREVASKQNLKPGTEEFFKACGKRFTEVVTQTQVYDSVFARSGIMRDKGDLNKFATSFMGEPTTSFNMIYNAILKAKRGGSKAQAVREISSVYVSIVGAAALASLIYGLRDDDEDEAYFEKWAEAFGNKLSSEIWIHNMIPYIRDVASILEGWDVERPDMSIFSDIKSSFDQLFKINDDGEFEWKVDFSDPKSVYSAIENFGGSIASAFGLPLRNLMRDTRGIFNGFKAIGDDIHPTDVGGAFAEGFTGKEKEKSDSLYEAIVSGDEGRLEIYRKGYKSEDSFETAVRKALRENDPRIKEAAQARYDGDIAEYTRIAKEIIAEGNFSQDTVVGAINSEITAIKKGETTEEEPTEDKDEVTSIYKTADINAAFESGDNSTALKIIDDLIETKVANGKTEKEAKSSLRSSMTSYWKPLYKEAYQSGNSSEMARIRKILYASNLYGSSNDVVKTCQNWLKD